MSNTISIEAVGSESTPSPGPDTGIKPAASAVKRCCKCKVTKPLEEFYHDKCRSDGRGTMCKRCGYIISRTTRLEYHRKYLREWKARHRKPKRVAMTVEQRRARDRDRRLAYRAAHPIPIYSAEERYAMHMTMRQLYRLSRPDIRRASKQRRRAREHGSEGFYSGRDWQALCARWDNRCLCCGVSAPLTVDHILPLVSGGSNFISNLQPLCMPCNVSKGISFIDFRPDHMLSS